MLSYFHGTDGRTDVRWMLRGPRGGLLVACHGTALTACRFSF